MSEKNSIKESHHLTNDEIQAKLKQEQNAELVTHWSILNSAYKGHTILKGIVSSIEEVSKMIVAVIYVGEYSIIIPYYNFFANPAEKTLLEQKRLLSKTIGVEVEFIITYLEKDQSLEDSAIIASRAETLPLRRKYMFGTDINGEDSRVKEGDELEATILSVGLHNLYVNVAGFDLLLLKHQVTCRHIDLLTEYYTAGEKILVTVLKIQREADGSVKSIIVSAVHSERKKMLHFLKRAKVGMNCIATITTIHHDPNTGHVTIKAFLDTINLPATVTITQLGNVNKAPVEGGKVLFTVTYVSEEKKHVYGRIVKCI